MRLRLLASQLFRCPPSRSIHTRSQELVNMTNRKMILVYLDQEGLIQEQEDKICDYKVLKALSARIRRELCQRHLTAFETSKLIDSPQIPYTVIISKRTLTDGILELKHFEPKIREQVHVSQLNERLLLQTGAVTLRCSFDTAAAAETDNNINKQPRSPSDVNAPTEARYATKAEM